MKAILEKVTTHPEKSVHAFAYVGERFAAPWHFHPEYELTLILQGSGIRYVGDHIGDFQPGDFVLLAGDLPHCWKNVASGPAHSLVIQWPAGLIGDIPEFSRIRRLLRDARRGLRFPEAVARTFQARQEKIVAGSPLSSYLELVALLHDLAEVDTATPVANRAYAFDGSPLTSRRLRTIHEYVAEHYVRKLTLAEVASQVNLSEQAFSRFFSKAMGRPFFQFLNEYRINVASKMLLDGPETVAEIGYSCGYDTLPFFYRQFRKFKGMSPARFRARKGR